MLGSASPRRRDILRGLGIPIRLLPADIVETPLRAEAPDDYLVRIVADKLAAVVARLKAGPAEPFAAVLVADTIVVVDEQILGKPTDPADAERLLARIVGRAHVVKTRYAVACAAGDGEARIQRTVETEVRMRAAAPEEVRRYARSGEGLDKAGAYAAQGLGTFLIERITGSYSNVVGLPACELIVDLRDLGLLHEFP